MVNRRSFLATSFAAVAALPGKFMPVRSSILGRKGTRVSADATEFYVAPNGQDGNPGHKSSPFATIQRARDEVHKLIANGLKSNVIVWIRGGTYTLQDTLIFGPEDSGTNQYSITYQAVPGQEPLISSGVKIEGWKQVETMLKHLPVFAQGNVWVADVPESLGRFYTLYDKQGHLPRAHGNGFIPDAPPEGAPHDWDAQHHNFYYPDDVIRNWSNLDDVEVVIRVYSSTMNILALESVDETAHLARTKLPATYPLPRQRWGGNYHFARTEQPGIHPLRRRAGGTPQPPSCWVENVLEGLDFPGAWVLNTHTRKLYLWPRTDRPEDIVAPRLRELIRVEGKIDFDGPTDVPVRNLIFRGLTFAYADRDVWTKDDIGIQQDWAMIDKPDALLRLRGAERCIVQNCKFRDSGGNAIRLDLYAQENRIEGNEIRQMGQAGILLIGYGPGVKDVNKRNEIFNNNIHHSGLIYWHSLGVMMWQSGENHVANNYIHHMPRHAISVSGVRVPFFRQPCDQREICKSMRWQEIGHPQTWDEIMPFLHSRNILIENNEVERVLEKLGDGAGINITGAGEGNVVRHNYVHDVFASEWVSGCLRTDDWQRGTTWQENIIYRSNAGAWEYKGANNAINNYAIDLLPKGYFRIYRDSIDGSVIDRNIFYNPNGPAVFYTFTIGPQQISKSKVEHNLYYCGGVEDSSTPEFLQILRAQGVSQTDVYADPMFSDLKPGYFWLKPNSLALKMGIKQIDLKGVGLRKSFPKWLLE